MGGLSPQDPIKLAAVTYFLKYALTHLGCKKHHKIHLRQATHVVSYTRSRRFELPDGAENVEVEVGSGGGTVHVNVQSRAAEAVGSDPVAGDGPGTSTGHAQIVDLQGVGEVRTCSINQ